MQSNAVLRLVPAPAVEPAAALRVALFSGNYNYVVDGPVKALNRLVAHIERRGDKALVFAPTAKTPAFRHSGELVSIPSVPCLARAANIAWASGCRARRGRGLTPFGRRSSTSRRPTGWG